MTERIGTLLAELADVGAAPVPAADPIWRRAGRTRIRRRAALAAAAVALGAAALALTTLSSQPIIGPASPPADGGVGGLEPLPPRLTAPFGEVPTVARLTTDRVQLLVETKLFQRTFFLPRPKRVCVAAGCGAHPVTLAVGSDHAYRHLIDPRRLSGQILLAPDGKYAAAVVSPLMLPVPLEEGRPEEGGPTVEQEWVLIDLTTGRTLPSVQCTGLAGWTRDGWFVCIPASGLPLTRYGIDSSGGLTGQEIGQTSTSVNGSIEIAPELLGRNATVLLGDVAEPGAIRITSVAAGPTETIFYPEATSVSPIGWCGSDTVLVVADGDLSVVDLEGGVLSRFPHPSNYGVLGCRTDGSVLLRVGDNLDKVALIRPDGSIAGEFSASSGSSPSATHVVDVAVDAVEWAVGGSPAHVPGFRPREWLDEALLVLVLVSAIGPLVVRRRRRERMAAATAGLA